MKKYKIVVIFWCKIFIYVILKYNNDENNDNDVYDVYVYILDNVCPSENTCSVLLTYYPFSSIKSFPSSLHVPIFRVYF